MQAGFCSKTHRVSSVGYSCEHAKTQLNLGYLIHPRTEGKGQPRGEGAELRTDQATAIRAAQGILLSTDARLNASGKQLDRQKLIGLMQVVESLHQPSSELPEARERTIAEEIEGAWQRAREYTTCLCQ